MELYITQDAIPFFDYWTDIRVFLPHIEGPYYDRRITQLLSNWALTKLYIWYNTSHPEYDDFFEFLIARKKSRIQNEPDRKEELEKALNEILDLDLQLRKSPPLYDWDPAYLIKKEFKPNNQ